MHHIGTTSPIHRRLDDEWQRLRRRPDALAHAGRWRIVTGPLHDLEQIVELTLPTRPDHEREPVLHALVERAADDELAARIVLQRLCPTSWCCTVGGDGEAATGSTSATSSRPVGR
jgi:hypothetical protein